MLVWGFENQVIGSVGALLRDFNSISLLLTEIKHFFFSYVCEQQTLVISVVPVNLPPVTDKFMKDNFI